MWRSPSRRRVADAPADSAPRAASLGSNSGGSTATPLSVLRRTLGALPSLPRTDSTHTTLTIEPVAPSPLLRSWPVDGVDLQLEVGVSCETLPQIARDASLQGGSAAAAAAARHQPDDAPDLHIDVGAETAEAAATEQVEEDDGDEDADGDSNQLPAEHIPPAAHARPTPPPPHARRMASTRQEQQQQQQEASTPPYPRSPSANFEPIAASAASAAAAAAVGPDDSAAVAAAAPSHDEAKEDELIVVDPPSPRALSPSPSPSLTPMLRMTPTPTPAPTTPTRAAAEAAAAAETPRAAPLSVTVVPADDPAPTPAPASASTGEPKAGRGANLNAKLRVVATLKRMALPMLVPLQPHEKGRAHESRPSGNFGRQRNDSLSINDSAGLGSHRLLTGSTRVVTSKLGPTSPKGGPLVADGGHKRAPSLDRPDALQGASPAALGLLSLDRTVLKRGDESGADGDEQLQSQQRPTGPLSWCHRVISPDARFLYFWRILILLFTLYNAVIVPYRLAFGGLPHSAHAQAVSFALDHIGDALFLLDMLIQARTGYVHHGVKQLNPDLVWKRYMRGWFLLDLAASLPFDLLQLGSMGMVPAVRLPKLLRLAKLGVLEELLENAPMLQMLQAPLIVLFVSHLAACAYMGIAHIEGIGSSPWVVTHELVDESSATFLYLYCLFWSYALLTDRDNEGVTPETTLQSLFTLTLMLLGMLGFALVVGSVAATVEAANEKMKEFQAKVAFVARFMSCFEVPAALKHQVNSFYEYMWSRDQGFDLPAVLAELPDVLTTDISMFLLQDIVQRVELFAGLDAAFVPALINRMSPAVYLPGESVCTQGDPGDGMFFLQAGEVDVLKAGPGGEERLLHTLPTGSSFGEYSLILPTQRTASVRAVGFCTIYVLSRENFEEVLRVFPKCAALIRTRAKAHHAATIKREQQLLRDKGVHVNTAAAQPSIATGADAIADPAHPPEIVRLVLQNKQNAKEYRKKISVYAFRVDSPVEVYKSWGLSKCAAGDWLVIGGDSDAYTVGHDLFVDTYEAIPQGAAHTFRKKGTVLAAQVARPLRVQTSKELLPCNAGDFLVQDDKLNQYCVPMASFQATYDPCVEKVVNKRAILDANSAAIRALKGRADESKMQHVDADVILPSSTFWQVWQSLIALVTLYNVFMLPFRWAFIFYSTHPAMLFFDYLGDALLLFDVYLRFRVAYLRDGTLVTDLAQIRAHYWSTWFAFDLVACFPLDFIMIKTGMQPLLRVGRMLKLYSLHLMTSDIIRNSPWAASLHLGRMLFAFVLTAHWTASLFWTFTYFEHFETQIDKYHWLPVARLEHADLTSQYLRAQFFAFVALTGYCGVDVPNTSAQALFSILIIMVGFFVVSLVIGEITSIVSNMDNFAAEHEKRSAAVEQFLHHHKLPLQLQERVRRFLAHEWSVQRGADPNKALDNLPPMLRLQVQMQISGDAIRRTPFFQAADATLLAVVSSLTFETYPGGECIFMAGQIGDKVYIVNRGLVAIRLPAKDAGAGVPAHTVKTVGKGSVFGETALLKNGRRTASAIAETSCDLMVIAKKDFLKIISDDPEFAEHLRSITDVRLQHLHALKRKKAAMSAAMRSHTSGGSAAGLGRRARHSMFVGEAPSMAAASPSPAPSNANPSPSPTGNRNRGAGGGEGGSIQLMAVGPTGNGGPISRSSDGGALIVAAAARHKQRSGSDGHMIGVPPIHRSFTLMTTARDQRNMMLLRRSQLQAGAINDPDPKERGAADDSASDPELELEMEATPAT